MLRHVLALPPAPGDGLVDGKEGTGGPGVALVRGQIPEAAAAKQQEELTAALAPLLQRMEKYYPQLCLQVVGAGRAFQVGATGEGCSWERKTR